MFTETFSRRALEAALACNLPADVARQCRLALSVMDTHGHPTPEEIAAQIGRNWVVARRTDRIVRTYGADVVCVTSKQLAAAEMRALEQRPV